MKKVLEKIEYLYVVSELIRCWQKHSSVGEQTKTINL